MTLGAGDAGFQQGVHLRFRDELTTFVQRVVNRCQLPIPNPAPHGGRAHLQPLACLTHRQHFLTLISHFIAVSHKIPVIVIRFYSFPFVTMKTNGNIRERLKTT